MRPYLFHVTTLARQLFDTINGDFARTKPLSEAAVLNFLGSLSKPHSMLSLILDRIDMITTAPDSSPPAALDDSSFEGIVRASAYGDCFGFSGLVLPFYRELQYRGTNDAAPQSKRTRARMQTLRTQAHAMTVFGARELARGIRYLPKIHYSPVHWSTIRAWAEFVADEADADASSPPSPE
ncbi:hypothetical protein C8R47DRAFT_144078 [Mycena vitilis]|nr:hypothetical protein C8R47DRAFT_144078 [Mycena vitilis]